MRTIASMVATCAAVSLWLGGVALAERAAPRAPLTPALIEGSRSPLSPAGLRTSQLSLGRYYRTATVTRVRSDGMIFASFSAEPQLIEPGAILVLEIHSIAKTGSMPRWRCIAVNDVAECLGTSVRVRYLPSDQRVVLRARLLPASDPHELVASLPPR